MFHLNKVLLLSLFSALALFVSAAHAGSYPEETRQAQELMDSTEVMASYHYCISGTMTCRSLVQLRDKVTAKAVPSFYDNFFSTERFVASTGYFLQNEDGTFRAFLDETFDGQVNISLVEEENQSLVITYDSDYFPTIHNVIFKRLGTTMYAELDVVYAPTHATLVGTMYDSENPDFKAPVYIYYGRVYEDKHLD